MPSLHTLLAFDTATGGCAAALWQEGRILAHRRDDTAHGQAARLVPLIETVLAEAGITYGDLDAIATTVGPGNFTGLRVGLATARGLALAAKKPLLGFTTLEILATQALDETPCDQVAAVIASGPRHCYAALYARQGTTLQLLREPSLVGMDEMAEFIPAGACIAGPAAETVAATVGPHRDIAPIAHPDVCLLARLAAGRGIPQDQPPLVPLYIRPPDAKLPQPILHVEL